MAGKLPLEILCRSALAGSMIKIRYIVKAADFVIFVVCAFPRFSGVGSVLLGQGKFQGMCSHSGHTCDELFRFLVGFGGASRASCGVFQDEGHCSRTSRHSRVGGMSLVGSMRFVVFRAPKK